MTTQLPTADTSNPIEVPTACAPYSVGDGITVLPSYLPVPGMGVLPSHAFLIDGPEPMLVDAGPGGAQATFQQALGSVIDPVELRWLWLTHTDPDHIGSLAWLLESAPNLRVVTTYLAVGKLSMHLPVPMGRLLWVNPGTSVELNGRRLHAVRPPSFDAPETVAFHDHTTGTLFSADSFGALLHQPAANAGDLVPGELADGMTLWSTIDSPWITHTSRAHFAQTLDDVRRLGATTVLSSHLPPAEGITDTLIDTLATVPGRHPWIGPDQHALDQILAALNETRIQANASDTDRADGPRAAISA
jgi:glyoxylase-like metal-dependent hydrolase (beta-lactamase superfamily II)